MNYFLIVPAAVIGFTLGYTCPGTDKERKVFADPAGPFRITNGIFSDGAISACNANFCESFFALMLQGFSVLGLMTNLLVL